MLPRLLEVAVLVDVDPDVQASRIAARPGTAATAAPVTADFLNRSRRVRSAAISHLPFVFESDQALDEGNAAAHIRHRSATGLRLRRQHDVLLEHIPTAVSGRAQLGHKTEHVDTAAAERSEETTPHGVAVREIPTPHQLREPLVDVFQMHVPDAPSGRRRHMYGVPTADNQVAGVQAEADVGKLEQAGDLRRALDDRAHVRMEGKFETPGVSDLLCSPETLEEGGP